MGTVPFIHGAKNGQAKIKQVLDDFLPADARVGFQEIISCLPGKAYGFAPRCFTKGLSVDGHNLLEVSQIMQVVPQIHPWVSRGLASQRALGLVLHY